MFLLLIACISEQSVKSEIEEARVCSTANDCVGLGAHCPFGCDVVVNKTEAERIQDLMNQYSDAQNGGECLYDCLQSGPIVCDAGLCGTEDTGM
jgi:hypothetical protein